MFSLDTEELCCDELIDFATDNEINNLYNYAAKEGKRAEKSPNISEQIPESIDASLLYDDIRAHWEVKVEEQSRVSLFLRWLDVIWFVLLEISVRLFRREQLEKIIRCCDFSLRYQDFCLLTSQIELLPLC